MKLEMIGLLLGIERRELDWDPLTLTRVLVVPYKLKWVEQSRLLLNKSAMLLKLVHLERDLGRKLPISQAMEWGFHQ